MICEFLLRHNPYPCFRLSFLCGASWIAIHENSSKRPIFCQRLRKATMIWKHEQNEFRAAVLPNTNVKRFLRTKFLLSCENIDTLHPVAIFPPTFRFSHCYHLYWSRPDSWPFRAGLGCSVLGLECFSFRFWSSPSLERYFWNPGILGLQTWLLKESEFFSADLFPGDRVHYSSSKILSGLRYMTAWSQEWGFSKTAFLKTRSRIRLNSLKHLNARM